MVVLVAAAAAGLVAGTIAWRLPELDPAAPHVAAETIGETVEQRPRLAAFVRARVDAKAATGLALTVALSLSVAGAIAVGALFVMAQHHALLARYDLSAARWGASHATAASTRFLRDISLFGGSTQTVIIVPVVVAIVEYVRTRTRALFAFLLVVVLGQTLIMNLVKLVVDRPRPDVRRLTGFSGSSFPSGHATAAAAVFAAVALLLGRRRSRPTKAVLAGAAAAIAVAVASSRVLLGVHWFTDVLAGLALGWAWFAVSSIAFGGRVLEFGRPVAVAERIEDAAHGDEPPAARAATAQRRAG